MSHYYIFRPDIVSLSLIMPICGPGLRQNLLIDSWMSMISFHDIFLYMVLERKQKQNAIGSKQVEIFDLDEKKKVVRFSDPIEKFKHVLLFSEQMFTIHLKSTQFARFAVEYRERDHWLMNKWSNVIAMKWNLIEWIKTSTSLGSMCHFFPVLSINFQNSTRSIGDV